jgi:DNA-binding transcriptional LysR family regulator
MRDPVLNSMSLSYFVRIAELGSLTAASRDLRVSQPSLSVAIKKLEEDLETTLFVRGRRGVTLTTTGEALLRHARHALRAIDEARREIHGLESDPRGHFVVGAHESLAAYCLPRFMASFLRAHSGISISLWNGNSREVERAVVEREVDVGLVVNPGEHPDTVVQPLFRDRVELIASATLLRRARKRRLADLLASHTLIYVPVLKQVQYILGALDQASLTPRQHLPCSSMELVKSLVVDGVGIGILPYRVAAHGVAAGRVVPASRELPSFDDTIALVRRFDMHLTAATRLLLDALRDHGRDMPKLPS